MTTEKQFLESVKVDYTYNSNPQKPPYALWCPPMNGKLIWVCARDEDNKLTSVFLYTGKDEKNPEKQINYIDNISKARDMRDELVQQGWKEISAPKVEFVMGDESKTVGE